MIELFLYNGGWNGYEYGRAHGYSGIVGRANAVHGKCFFGYYTTEPALDF